MSGTFPLQSQQFPIYPITIDTLPRGKEGSKALFIPITWLPIFEAIAGTGGGLPTRLNASLNLLQQYQTGQFTTVQAIYVDNSTCCYPVVVTSLETGQVFNVNPFTKGMYPLFASVAPSFLITLEFFQTPNYLNAYGLNNLGTTRVTLLNTPQRYFESTYTGTPLNFFTSFAYGTAGSAVILTDVTAGSPGNGMLPIDANTLKRIQQIYFSFSPNVAFAAVTAFDFEFIEVSPSAGNLVHFDYRGVAPVGQIEQTIAIGFPGGLLQVDPASSFAVIISVIPPASTWGVRGNIQYNQLTFG